MVMIAYGLIAMGLSDVLARCLSSFLELEREFMRELAQGLFGQIEKRT
jgi:hypothetical protein